LGSLSDADESYSRSIGLCQKQLEELGDQTFGVRRCDDLYLLLLNRGSVRLNNGMAREALQDLEQADRLRGKPDAVILQNRARARELNSLYSGADRDYTVAISMTSNEVAPFWLRSGLVKFQLGERLGAMDLIRRVENRFPEAPEVRAALAAMLWEKGDQDGARRKFLEIPNQARLKFSDTAPNGYMKATISWPPAMIENINQIAKAVGDQ
jgi:tetratricopeptide (TPR) repeat protein